MRAVAPATVRLAASISRRARASRGAKRVRSVRSHDGVGVEEGVALLGEAVAAPAELGAAGVEALEAAGEGEGGVAVGGGVHGGGLGVEGLDAGEAAEGPELADELDGDDEGEERPRGRGRACRGGEALEERGEVVVGGDGDDEGDEEAGEGPEEAGAAAAAAGGEADGGLHGGALGLVVGRGRGVGGGEGRRGELVGGDDEGVERRIGAVICRRSPIRNSAARSRRMWGRPSPEAGRRTGGAKRVTR